MKTPKPKKCKECGNKFIPLRPLQSVCDYKCAHERTRKREQKRVELARVQQRKQDIEGLMTKGQWIELLQKVFNTFIRMRDANEPCISCGCTYANKWDCGHFYPTTYSALRFNEDNCNKQCSMNCNMKRSGNVHEYRPRLIKKIGMVRVKWLDDHAHDKFEITIDEIKELIKEYRMKIKQLKQCPI